jgi:hypothetical protein
MLELKNVEADMAVDQIDQTAFVQRDVIALRRGRAARRFWNEKADFPRGTATSMMRKPAAKYPRLSLPSG